MRRAGGDAEELWFAQLRLVFSCRDQGGAEHQCAFVRWLSPDDEPEVDLQRLRWAPTVNAAGAAGPWYDVIPIECIVRPVLIQSDPERPGFFYCNKFVGR